MTLVFLLFHSSNIRSIKCILYALSRCVSIIQEEYLKVFLTDGEVPIDDSASERTLRNFTIVRKNWGTINTVRGAQASARPGGNPGTYL